MMQSATDRDGGHAADPRAPLSCSMELITCHCAKAHGSLDHERPTVSADFDMDQERVGDSALK